jgi:hypothetical protein
LNLLKRAFPKIATALIESYDGSTIKTDDNQNLIGEKYLTIQINKIREENKKKSILDKWGHLLYDGEPVENQSSKKASTNSSDSQSLSSASIASTSTIVPRLITVRSGSVRDRPATPVALKNKQSKATSSISESVRSETKASTSAAETERSQTRASQSVASERSETRASTNVPRTETRASESTQRSETRASNSTSSSSESERSETKASTYAAGTERTQTRNSTATRSETRASTNFAETERTATRASQSTVTNQTRSETRASTNFATERYLLFLIIKIDYYVNLMNFKKNCHKSFFCITNFKISNENISSTN